ncbi:dTDP-4-amino-4,6-dideoxy-D-glucose transaminase [compost metagenome]
MAIQPTDVQKRDARDLAALGGSPLFEAPLHVGAPNIGSRDALMARMNNMLDRRWLTNAGPFVQEFERRLCEQTGAKHAIAMCNATVALEIAIRALDLKGEVIVPSFTFVATAHALQWQEITPVFCDVDPATHTLDPAQIEKLITPRTTGIIGVHLWGRPCDVEALQAIADKHGLKLLFDAAHAFNCTHGGVPVGNFGSAEVFSFHATKFLNAFEGGAVVTNDDALAAKIRLMQNFGFSGYDNVVYVGTNGKMNEASAAMGLTSLDSIETFLATNHLNYLTYRRLLDGVPGLSVAAYDEREANNFQYVIVEVDEAQAGISRDRLVQVLHAENVLARRYFYPGCHRMEPYRSYFPHAGLLLPHTVALAERVMALPTGTAVDLEQIGHICALIRFAVAHADAIQAALA